MITETKPVIIKEVTENKKLGFISTTYAAINSCPSDCPFKKTKACYGMRGPISWKWLKLTGSPMAIAKAEAAGIRSLSGLRDLRIHTLGDCSSDKTAKIVSEAAEVFMRKRGKAAFTYTHAWKKVARKSWGKVSVLASCETPDEVRAAKAKGFATALVVPKFDSSVAYMIDGLKIVPCPEMTGRCKTCEECRLCMRDDKLKAADVTIAFAAHGPTTRMQNVLAEKNS